MKEIEKDPVPNGVLSARIVTAPPSLVKAATVAAGARRGGGGVKKGEL